MTRGAALEFAIDALTSIGGVQAHAFPVRFSLHVAHPIYVSTYPVSGTQSAI
jgi:hypothetical protein